MFTNRDTTMRRILERQKRYARNRKPAAEGFGERVFQICQCGTDRFEISKNAAPAQWANANLKRKRPNLRIVEFSRRREIPRLPVRISIERGGGRFRQFTLSEGALREIVDHAIRLEGSR